ncbi:MAG: hypothetical protein JW983_00555 [Elusimicrobia bacterium]|nr:hypothetical protein [Elusimicrobiota bacterium]
MRKAIFIFGLLFVSVSFCSAEPYDYLAKRISKGAKKLTNKKVAVLPFQYYDGRKSPGSNIVSEHLITKIVERGKLQVVERALLNKIMDEMKLEQSGVIDQETTKELGKVLGVEAVVTGTLIEETDSEWVNINTRLIKVETGDILVAASKEVKKTWEDATFSVVEDTPEEKTEESPAHEPDMKVEEPESIKIGPGDGEKKIPEAIVELKKSHNLFKAKRYKMAIDEAKNVLKKYSDKPVVASRALFIIGRSHEFLKQPRMARAAYIKIIKDYPLNTKAVKGAQERLRYLDRGQRR